MLMLCCNRLGIRVAVRPEAFKWLIRVRVIIVCVNVIIQFTQNQFPNFFYQRISNSVSKILCLCELYLEVILRSIDLPKGGKDILLQILKFKILVVKLLKYFCLFYFVWIVIIVVFHKNVLGYYWSFVLYWSRFASISCLLNFHQPKGDFVDFCLFVWGFVLFTTCDCWWPIRKLFLFIRYCMFKLLMCVHVFVLESLGRAGGDNKLRWIFWVLGDWWFGGGNVVVAH